jgi:hypothetical protein
MPLDDEALARRSRSKRRRKGKGKRRRHGPRISVCVSCRTLLPSGEDCDGGDDHEVASLRHAAGRERLLEAVWGPPPVRFEAKKLLKVGGSGAGFLLLTKFWWYGIGSSHAWFAFLVIALAAAGLYWLLTLIRNKLQARREAPLPRGAERMPLLSARRELRGRVVAGGEAVTAPASKRSCRAWALTLCADRHHDSPVVLRHATCASLAIDLDDGSCVELPAGRIRLDGPVRSLRAKPSNMRRVHDELGLPHEDDGDLSPFPCDRLEETVLRDGDEVLVRGEFEREPLGGSANVAYREARWCYRPSSVIHLSLAP